MSGRQRQAGSSSRPRTTAAVALLLSGVAVVTSVAALWITINRAPEPDPCRSLAWGAVPAAAELPAGWTLASNRFFVDNSTTALVGPAPSGATEGPGVYISVSCYGSDAAAVLPKAHQAALATGAKDWAVAHLGDESFAVAKQDTGTTVFVRRGDLVADITAPPSVDQPSLEGLLYALDQAMVRAVAGGQAATTGLSAEHPALSGSQPIVASPRASLSSKASASATPASHVAADLEALLPRAIGGTSMWIDSVTGSTALGNDATSKAFIDSLAKLGKTVGDLEIARALDPTGKVQIRVLAFRIQGVGPSDMNKTLADALLSDATSSPKASQAIVGGLVVTKIAYDKGPAEYLYEGKNGVVFDVETTDEALAKGALALLK